MYIEFDDKTRLNLFDLKLYIQVIQFIINKYNQYIFIRIDLKHNLYILHKKKIVILLAYLVLAQVNLLFI